MRRYLLIMTVGWVVLLFSFVGINWLVDPYRIFHEPWVRDNYYASDRSMREAAAGIINTEHFEAVILGSSMAANFSPKEASALWGQRFVNISMDGSGIPERSLVLSYALSKKTLSTIIFSFDWDSLRSRIENAPIAPYTFLYDESRVNDIRIYVTDPKVFRYALCRNFVFSSNFLCQNLKEDLETLVEWHSSLSNIKRFGGLNKWFEAINNEKSLRALAAISKGISAAESGRLLPVNLDYVRRRVLRDGKVFMDTVMRIALENSDTQFYLFFPPYSRLRFGIMKQSDPQRFEEYLGILRFVVNECAKAPNIHVFGFETENFLDDIANYKDSIHFHQRFNSAMLHWMRNGEHQLTPENIEPYIMQISERAAGYPLKEFGARINAYLANLSGRHPKQGVPEAVGG